MVAVVAAVTVAVAGWLLLLLVKGAVVLTAYLVGVALVVLPLLMSRRLLTGLPRRARIERLGSITAAVLLGVALLVLGRLVSQHGWLLIAVPAAVVGLTKLAAGVRARRAAAR